MGRVQDLLFAEPGFLQISHCLLGVLLIGKDASDEGSIGCRHFVLLVVFLQ
jgi:hypothetical protein